MVICDNGHGKVAFEGFWDRDCPACVALDELREQMQDEIDRLNEDIKKTELDNEPNTATG